MKSLFTSLFSLAFAFITHAQNDPLNLAQNLNPRVKKEAINKAVSINDLSPLIWSRLSLSSNDRYGLTQRRINNFAQPQPADYLYPQEDYSLIVQVVFTEISLKVNGVTKTAQSTSDKLTARQKEILNAGDMGSDISIKLRYKYIDQTKDNFGSRNTIAEGSTGLTLVPETEAEYPGGLKQLSAYFTNQVTGKIADKKLSEKLLNAIIRFTVDQDGRVLNPELVRTSTDTRIDRLLLEAMQKMPLWKPSVNGQGTKIKQEFTIPFSSGC